MPPSVVPPLPPPARRFLRSAEGRRVRRVVLALQRWMIFRRLELRRLTRYRLARFVANPERVRLSAALRRRYSDDLRVYLRWLWRQRLIPFDPDRCRAAPFPLPPSATAYLDSLRATLRPSTCSGYSHALRHLHRWLAGRRLSLAHLTRRRLEPWLRHLHERKLAPATRLSLLFNARAYLHWLAERRLLRAHPDDLIRRTDLPRLPTYLPRPLPPEIDRELRHRLAQAEGPFALGLLLMRRTGIRVGELLGLERECLRTDGQDHWYLKVPLGKLHTERLVPLAADTVALVRRIQDLGRSDRPTLLTPSYKSCRDLLRAVTADLQDAAPITTHRLRHTFATELLNAGMSLVGLMRILGHRDYRMTLRYAAITNETVGKEYFRAIEHVTDKYRLPPAPEVAEKPDPRAVLDDLARWARQHSSATTRLRPLLNRITRLQRDLERLGSAQSK